MDEVIYEVNLEIQKEYVQEYMEWLRPHSMKMLELDGFISCKISNYQKVKETNDPSLAYKVVTYRVRSMKDLQNYFDFGAAKMRGQATNKFKGKFKAWRRVIKPKESHHILSKSKL